MCKECKDLRGCNCNCYDEYLIKDYYGVSFCIHCGCHREPELEIPLQLA